MAMQTPEYSKAYNNYLNRYYSGYLNKHPANTNQTHQTNTTNQVTDQALVNEIVSIKWLLVGLSIGISIGIGLCLIMKK